MKSKPRPLILGLNKYTHSAAACLLDEKGTILFAQSKERVTRKKHDGGEVSDLVRYALERTDRRLDEIGTVVQNNHLFSIAEYERRLAFDAALHAAPPGSLDPHNLLLHAKRWELSHHLAHVWSAAAVAPFSRGLIVVMDGMGSPRELAAIPGQGSAFTDGDLEKHPRFREFPSKLEGRSWREGESVYEWRDGKLRLLFKRWIEQRSPSFLYNYGFENMESLGAVYSRVSSHLFGDWNQCGKVMGLAAYGRAARVPSLMTGPLEKLRVRWDTIHSLPHPNAWGQAKSRRLYEDLAARVQEDLECTALDFLRRLQRETKAKHLAFTGGVALNSLLNGRIAAELPFETVFVPPYPGDEGVAVGCAYFAHSKIFRRPAPSRLPCAFLGASFSRAERDQALEEFAPWVEVEFPRDFADAAARALASHRFVAWFQGRSEFGPRALGHRSILAHPGKKSTWKRLNDSIKKRESFRPFAPAARAEKASAFFRLAGDSRFMSLTVPAKATARKKLQAVVHVDGSSRLQTVRREDCPRFYDLLLRFEERTGLPVLLNTSFNIEGEPIVESPADAIRSFLDSALDLLVLGDALVRKKAFPARKLWRRIRVEAREDALIERRSLPDGRSAGAQISLRGNVFEADESQLACLEAASKGLTLEALVRNAKKNDGLTESAAIEAIRFLWKRRALKFLGL